MASIGMRTDNAKQTTTARDVARVARVSHGTVSNVFNKPEIVRPAVRERVLAAAKEVGYGGPDLIARLLNTGKVNAIGVATKESLTYFFEDPFARELLRSIAAAGDAAGVGLSLISARNSDQSTWNINSAVVDGLIMLCGEGGAPLVELARAR
jgi:DNA-binding LacI/PurR family transcriptional regulator